MEEKDKSTEEEKKVEKSVLENPLNGSVVADQEEKSQEEDGQKGQEEDKATSDAQQQEPT